MKQKTINKKIFILLLTLLGFSRLLSQQLAPIVPGCTTSYSVINPQGIVVTSGVTNASNNPVFFGSYLPKF